MNIIWVKVYRFTMGSKKSSGDYIFFLDADLMYLNAQILLIWCSPYLNGAADVSISLRKNTPIQWHILGIDYITGERILPRDTHNISS